jgi:hypothetical protein
VGLKKTIKHISLPYNTVIKETHKFCCVSACIWNVVSYFKFCLESRGQDGLRTCIAACLTLGGGGGGGAVYFVQWKKNMFTF